MESSEKIKGKLENKLKDNIFIFKMGNKIEGALAPSSRIKSLDYFYPSSEYFLICSNLSIASLIDIVKLAKCLG